jgi:hypothetical protein
MNATLMILIPTIAGLAAGLAVLWLAKVLAARARRAAVVRRIREL